MFNHPFMPHLISYPTITRVRGRPDFNIYDYHRLQLEGINLVVGDRAIPSHGKWETMDLGEGSLPATHPVAIHDVEYALQLSDRYNVIVMNAILHRLNPIYLYGAVKSLYVMLKVGGLAQVEVPFIWREGVSDHSVYSRDFTRFTREGLRATFEEHPECNWSTLVCQYFIPQDCPEGVGVSALFQKEPLPQKPTTEKVVQKTDVTPVVEDNPKDQILFKPVERQSGVGEFHYPQWG
jgi:hypothetical protein